MPHKIQKGPCGGCFPTNGNFNFHPQSSILIDENISEVSSIPIYCFRSIKEVGSPIIFSSRRVSDDGN